MESWNTDWDPYEELMQHRHNIKECAMAINAGSEVMKDLAQKYHHQQQIIQRLNLDLDRQQAKINLLQAQINSLNTSV